MKVVILGGGIAGVTNAYYLAREGHEVVVVDRQPEVARETSFANAGLVAPGHAYTWASPRAPKILLKSLFLKGQALRLKLRADPRMWAWGLQFLKHCTAERARENTARKLAAVDKVPLVMGAYSSGVTIPMVQYLVKEGVTHLNISSSSTKVRELGASAFSVVGLENFGNQFAARDTYALGYRRVALIAPNNAYGQGVLEGDKTDFETLGGKVIAEALYTAGQSTYLRELQQLSRSQPDAYVYTAYGQESAILNREAMELGLRDKPWYGYDGVLLAAAAIA